MTEFKLKPPTPVNPWGKSEDANESNNERLFDRRLFGPPVSESELAEVIGMTIIGLSKEAEASLGLDEYTPLQSQT